MVEAARSASRIAEDPGNATRPVPRAIALAVSRPDYPLRRTRLSSMAGQIHPVVLPPSVALEGGRLYRKQDGKPLFQTPSPWPQIVQATEISRFAIAAGGSSRITSNTYYKRRALLVRTRISP